jgi:hypothetical protein
MPGGRNPTVRQLPMNADPKDAGRMRILIAPHEIAGQMQILASTFRKLGQFATAVNYFEPNWLYYVNDVNLGFRPKQDHTRRYINMIAFALWAAVNFDVFHFFFGKSLLYNRHIDLPILKRLGKKIFVHFRGSEVRNDAQFTGVGGRGGTDASGAPMQTPNQIRLVDTWRKYANGIFVSTPGAHLIPQVIDLDEWRMDGPRTDRSSVVIGHAPTSRVHKGTAQVITAVERLQQKGLPVELRLIEGLPHHRVQASYADCDIAIDQLLHGWYGNFAVEMMALAKPVVCFIEPRLRETRMDLPLVQATPTTLSDVLEPLVVDRSQWKTLGTQGRTYVEHHHCVRKTCANLLTLYERA